MHRSRISAKTIFSLNSMYAHDAPNAVTRRHKNVLPPAQSYNEITRQQSKLLLFWLTI